MWLYVLPLGAALVGGLVLACRAYYSGRVAYSSQATRSEKNLRHMITLVVFSSGLLFGYGMNTWGAMSDEGFIAYIWLMSMVFLGRSIFIELGIRRVNADVD
ncbi:hypothetical protein C5Y96_13820 [Blastopirellula marina]|uniref:Uncharacterized protein n=1 Tax=Blastopirellula marina TaxID=124 RepID=A0A2S8FH04_9BACT|nr:MULTISPECIES: hypothetical protein [Pirellulaceae]PQO31412.1 hypothetical protein C5Y96_13820 [Blastopirellula marina]RCS51805.1 hypothetical protein DTL36_13830 [Bremerella cremea]